MRTTIGMTIGTSRRHRRTRRTSYAAARNGGLASRRLYAGRRNALAVQGAFFSARATRQMTTRGWVEPWLGGAAMMAGVAGWGLLLSLLGG
jgi:hypothetical protein